MRKLRRFAVWGVALFVIGCIVHLFVYVSRRIFPEGIQIKSEVLGQVDYGRFRPADYITKVSDIEKKDPYHSHGFHIVNSRNARWDRTLTDFRSSLCREEKFSGLSPTSIIIAFHNEERSALLRTVVSVLQRSPPHLIKEIILIDDNSDNGLYDYHHSDNGLYDHKDNVLYDNDPIDNGLYGRHHYDNGLYDNDHTDNVLYDNDPIDNGLYGRHHYDNGLYDNDHTDNVLYDNDHNDNEEDGKLLATIPKVTLHRSNQREGAIRSRVWGAEIASGEIITFLDSHCEVNDGWLEPLLYRIKEDPLVVAVPLLDTISSSSLQLSPTDPKMIGGFDWTLKFKWESMPEEDYAVRRDSDPIKTPVMFGAAFSVHKDTFDRLELSLRTWMCGGSIEILPCSRIGHIFRKRHPYTFPDDSTSMYIRNARRVAEVWMDEYKRFFYTQRPTARLKPYGSVADRKKLRQQLKCQSFKWYLQTVYTQLRSPVIDELAYGMIQQDGLCMDIDPGHVPVITKLNTCSDQRSSQEWFWKKSGKIISNGMCLSADVKETHGYVLIQYCSGADNQLWYRDKLLIVHQASRQCIDSHKAGIGLVLSECDSTLKLCRHSYTVQELLHCAGTLTLYRSSNTVEELLHCSGNLKLCRHSNTVKELLHCSGNLKLCRHSYTVKELLHCTGTLKLCRHSNTVKELLHCTGNLKLCRYSYTVKELLHCSGTLKLCRHSYTVQELLHCTGNLKLCRYSYTVQELLHCSGTLKLCRHSYTVQELLHCTGNLKLCRYSYTVQELLQCTGTLKLCRHSYTVQELLHYAGTLTLCKNSYTVQVLLHYTGAFTLYRYSYTVQVLLSCAGTLTMCRYSYTIQELLHCACTLTLYRSSDTVQVLLYCADTLTLYRSSYTVQELLYCAGTLTLQELLHCAGTLTLYRSFYTVQVLLYCADTLTLYRSSYTVQELLHCAGTLILCRYSYTTGAFTLCRYSNTIQELLHCAEVLLHCAEVLLHYTGTLTLCRSSYTVQPKIIMTVITGRNTLRRLTVPLSGVFKVHATGGDMKETIRCRDNEHV
ncbi:hypothetical protein FSP39_017090 [Pinctada imbricata]|uniref:Ricin B lectin domain-containing protein n=1 Tax=Pinctada imbricata TaxID=66713 RepID=A0AA88XX04_PINIB|nr:hypothetical protein FSP39_017090 [Pinctada imbricata]